MSKPAKAILLLVLTTAGCDRAPAPVMEAPSVDPTPERPNAAVTELRGSSDLITTEGIGQVTLGMTRRQFEAATGAKVISSEMGCGDNPVDIVGGPVTMSIRLSSSDLIDAITVDDPRYATAQGAKVGMTSAELQQIYGSQLTSFPYEGDSDPPQYGQYAIATADGARSVAFTMKDARVSFITVIRGKADFQDLC